MNGEERRNQIFQILSGSSQPVSGAALAKQFQVSRQVIVQDIALLRANGAEIFSASRGYLIPKEKKAASRILKVFHTDAETEEELNLVVDSGGKVQDVFIYHKAFGVVRADMNIRSRQDIQNFMKDIRSGKSSLLKNVTAGYHYHTILAEDEQTLDLIQEKFRERGLLAKLQDYEPVNFWEKTVKTELAEDNR